MALIASPTTIGVLGITRTTGVPGGSAPSNKAMGRPAHRVTTSVPGRSTGASSVRTGAMSWGFTATTSTSACAAASATSTAEMPCLAVSSAARSGWRSVNTSSSGVRPAASSPCSNASPILPAPKTATTPMPGG